MSLYRKSIRVTAGILVVYALLVATHLGEFWPFSIYPMFSQAGNPWSRSIVRQVPPDDAVRWDEVRLDELPGEDFQMVANGINQNDVANYLSKTDRWTETRIRGFRSIFSRHSFDTALLVYNVRGSLQNDTVDIEATPIMQLRTDTTLFHPDIAVARRSSSPTAALNGVQ
jgi:hypothetical protein